MWTAEKPSNIAFIKYMGKLNSAKNKPTNSSLSWTLNHLKTKVVIEKSSGTEDQWQPLASDYPFEMSPLGREKYLNHLGRLKTYFGIEGFFTVQSGNNFPADCGIASSASSFAALTEAACLAFSELTGREISVFEKANLSSQGSGSSCRSFHTGWVLWDGNKVENVQVELGNMLHMVILVGSGTKKVSSSQAHKIVSSSLLFEGRSERAETRLDKFVDHLQNLDWSNLFQLGWEEFYDMHALFETSNPSFGYFLPGTITVLNTVREFWQSHGDGPLVTMDAGPNIHMLWREDQQELALQFFSESLADKWTCLSDIDGIGFAKV